jgi:Leu/Phe-tRNA-protein transferase
MLEITGSGHFFIAPDVNTDFLIDIIIAANYREEFCLSLSFSPGFIADLMYSGFLVMSARIDGTESENETELYVLLPKHHLVRNVLFFDELHVSKTAGRMIKRCSPMYKLCVNTDYDAITAKCVERHGDGWLTKPLLKSMSRIRKSGVYSVTPCSFALYRDGVLCAGEFGVVAGRVYTSYSGWHDGNSEGTAQMILTARYLQNNGFAFWDLGMPLDYKYTLGARDIGIKEFIRIFRDGRDRGGCVI